MLERELKFGAFPWPFCTEREGEVSTVTTLGILGLRAHLTHEPNEPRDHETRESLKGEESVQRPSPTHLTHEPNEPRDHENCKCPKGKCPKVVPTHLAHEPNKPCDRGDRESPKGKCPKAVSTHLIHTSPMSRVTVEIVRARKESVQRPSQTHLTHEPNEPCDRGDRESPKGKCPRAVPTHLQSHVVWSWAFKCSVKSRVTRPPTKMLFQWISIHAGISHMIE
jgi:hypothetical protein